MASKKFIIGSRGSRLSLVQAGIVQKKLESLDIGLDIEVVKIKTMNEKIDRNIVDATEKDIYTKEIDQALLDGSIDMAVHSLKDLNLELPKGIVMGAVPDRADPGEVFISRDGTRLEQLGKGAVIGTSSIRRKAQLFGINPLPKVEDIHGNIDSRIGMVEEGSVDGIMIAAAGIERLGLKVKSEYFEPSRIVPAIGQGALAVSARATDSGMLSILKRINDPKAELETSAEREFGKVFGVGCNAPIGANARISGDSIKLTGFIGDGYGGRVLKMEMSGGKDDAIAIGRKLARELMDSGGGELIGET